jgi:8-oxo-dGTP pyrophosphatase MutT (NUDIX family)
MDAPRLAASVILARAAAHGFELYMTRRSARSGFAPGAFVFPGGTIEAQDAAPAAKARTLGLEHGRLAESRVEVSAAVPIAALRELFEEAGILIARSSDGAAIGPQAMRSAGVASERLLVCNATETFAGFLQRHDWYADASELALFSHWITPASEARRYDTYFFFATAPYGEAGEADAFETHDGLWISAAEALDRYRSGTFHLVFPTLKHLERLAAFDSLHAVLQFARSKAIVTILPATSTGGFDLPAGLERAW